MYESKAYSGSALRLNCGGVVLDVKQPQAQRQSWDWTVDGA